jgi:hypothetical protein
MSDLVKLRQIGNSDGLTFRNEGLRIAGIARGDQVRVDYKPGRIEITSADDVRAKCREGFDLFVRRYDRALRVLAR